MVERHRQRGYQLRLWAIALGGLAFGFLLMAQLAVRYWFHVPAMQQLVDVSDQKDRARVEAALQVRMAGVLSRALDNAVWDEAYDFVRAPNERFIARSFDARSLDDNEISGLAYIDLKGQVLWALGYQWEQVRDGFPAQHQLPMSGPQILQQLLIDSHQAVNGEIVTHQGLLAVADGPLMFASAPVFPTNFDHGEQSSAGVLVMWQWLDQNFWEEIAANTQLKLRAEYLPRQLDSLSSEYAHLKTQSRPQRDRANELAWLLEGQSGAIMLLVLNLGPPQFDSGVITDALLVGMIAASVLLLVLGACVRHWLIQPLVTLRDQMEAIQRAGDFGQRLNVNSYEELQRLSEQFNLLLAEVQRQQTLAHRRQAELQLASISDGLTGLANRRYLDQFMDESWARAQTERLSFCLILLDVDYFKDYNDRYGHDEGDQVLRQVARRLRERQPAADAIAARYGGEEFCLVAVGLGVAEFETLIDLTRRDVMGLDIPHEKSTFGIVTASLGGVFVDAADVKLPQFNGRDALRTLFKAADGCLYEAKRAGRNQARAADARGLGAI